CARERERAYGNNRFDVW
nr:immunoglobulin heavy chain junction region [Macaca mulatta]MOV39803.1 immunoglobulin heavy chain junction region [Macaca mulatta]